MPFELAALAHPQIDPILISIGPLAIHWYGVGYVVGILFGWWYARRLVSTPSLWGSQSAPYAKEDIDDFLMWAVVGIVLGGRLGYVLFYDLATYLADPLKIVLLNQGGMSFHGGLAGIIIAMILFARSRNASPYSLFDVIAASSGIGIFLVRVANFINAELYGKPSDVPWAVIFPGTDGQSRHPSQLYEGALEGLILFALLAWLIWSLKKLRHPGFVGGAFLAGYAISRIAVEFVRLPDAQLGYLLGSDWITMGMVLSIPVLFVGLWGMATACNREKQQTVRAN